ncbi:MAG: endolytic transglycosylase MltG, partial [Microbacterium sp.]
YRLNKELKASAALSVLVDPDNLIKATVTIPEGFRLNQIVDRLVAKTDFSRKQINAAIANPAALGLPADADGNLQGYLFPATYTILPGATAKSLLTQMVDQTKKVEQSLGIKAKAAALGLTPHQVLTVASILEYEAGTDEDYPKVARVLYNRLDRGMALQLDSTVAFANNSTGSIYTTAEERAVDSPYNTYKYAGLPPGPIGAAGEKAIKAALNPTPGDWLYFVLINPETGETRFNTTLEGHNRDDALFDQYCREHEGAC